MAYVYMAHTAYGIYGFINAYLYTLYRYIYIYIYLEIM